MDERIDLDSFFQEHDVSWPVMVGASGGADSWGMLLRLLARAPSSSDVIVLHYHHSMAAHGTEAYEALRDWCFRRNVPFVAARRLPGEPEGNEEVVARRRRYEFFRSAARSLGRKDLFLAHHRADQVETILMNLGRGTGVDGLTGMDPVRESGGFRVLRPALSVLPETLQQPVTGKIPVVEDPDNRRRDRARTLLRHELLPRWRRVQPDPDSGVLSAGRHAREIRRFLDRHTDETFRYWIWQDEVQIDRRDFQQASGVLRRRLMRRLVGGLPGGIGGWERVHFELLEELFLEGRSGAGVDLPNGLRGRREQQRLAIYRPRPSLEPRVLTPGDTIRWPDRGRLNWGSVSGGSGGFPLESFLHFNATRIRVRSWERGDRFPESRGGRSVKELFDDHAVPYRARRFWPVVLDDQGIVVLPGLEASPEGEPDEESGRIRWEPRHPSYHQFFTRRLLP